MLRFLSCSLIKIQRSAFAVKIPFTNGISTGTPPPTTKVNPKACPNTQAGHAKCQRKPPKPLITYISIHTYQTGQFEKISSWPASTTAHFMFGQLGVGIMTSLPSPCSKREWKTAVTSKICPSTKAQLAGESKKKRPTYGAYSEKARATDCWNYHVLPHGCIVFTILACVCVCVFFKAKEPLPSRHCKQSCARDQQLSCTPARNSGNTTGNTSRFPHYPGMKTPFLMS